MEETRSTETVLDEETGKQRIVHEPTLSRQVRRQQQRRREKQIQTHMNETVLKKNKRRGHS